MEVTAVEWFYDKIKSHFEHDGDALETLTMTYAIAKLKQKQQIIDAWQQGHSEGILDTHTVAKDYYTDTYGQISSETNT